MSRPPRTRTGWTVRSRLPRPGRRGYSLVELAAVAGLTTLLMVLLLRWVLALILASTATLDTAGRVRDATYAGGQLRADLAAVEGCDPYGLDAPFLEISRTRFVAHADVVTASGPGSDGIVDVVAWRVDGTSLQRATVTGTGTCDFDLTGLDWRIVAEDLRPSSHERWAEPFTGLEAGVRVTEQSRYGTCTGMDAESCMFDALAVHLFFEPAGNVDVAYELDDTYPINLSWSALGTAR